MLSTHVYKIIPENYYPLLNVKAQEYSRINNTLSNTSTQQEGKRASEHEKI